MLKDVKPVRIVFESLSFTLNQNRMLTNVLGVPIPQTAFEPLQYNSLDRQY